MTRILISLLAAFAIACVVLALMLRVRDAEISVLEQHLVVKEALVQQASTNARTAIASLQAERAIRMAQAREIDLLHAQLDTIARTRPNFTGRPRPSDAAGLRASILRATRQ